MRPFILICAAILLHAVPLAAQAGEPLRIVATTTQASDLARILTEGISEELIQITGLMGSGVDPHLYKPTEADTRAMSQADALVYMGLHLEGRFDEIFAALAQQGTRIVRLAQPIEAAGYVLEALEDGEGAPDPHFWFDPRNWALSAEALADALSDLLPQERPRIEANLAAYQAQLDALFVWAVEGMGSVPEGQRYLVTSHDAFHYFGLAFGWQMQAIQGVSTASEAGVGDIQATVRFIVENEIPVVFVESTIPLDTIESVREAVRAGGGTVEIGLRELYSDAMGAPDEFGGTYVGMIAHNVYTILQSYALAGVAVDIPEWPDSVTPQPPAEWFLEGEGDA